MRARDERSAPIALALFVACAGCGGTVPLTAIANGGGALAPGHCTEASIVDRGEGMKPTPPKAAQCEAGTAFLVPEGAAGVVWQIGAAPWAGPIVSNRVDVMVPDRRVVAGEGATALTMGGDAKSFSGGGDAKAAVGPVAGGSGSAVAAGGGATGPVAGEGARGPAAGPKPVAEGGDAKVLDSGGEVKTLGSGGAARALEGGGDAKAAPTGGAARSPTPERESEARVISLRKSASTERADTGEPVTFRLVAKNVSQTTLSRLVIVDRLSRRLRHDRSDADRALLDDGTTLLVWTVAKPLPPGAEVNVDVTVVVR